MCVLASIAVCNYPAQREVGSDSVWTAPWLRLNVDPMAGIPNLSVWRDAEVGSIGAMKRSSDAKASTCRPCSAMYSFWFQTRAQKQRRRKARHNVSRSDLAIKRNLCNLYTRSRDIQYEPKQWRKQVRARTPIQTRASLRKHAHTPTLMVDLASLPIDFSPVAQWIRQCTRIRLLTLT